MTPVGFSKFLINCKPSCLTLAHAILTTDLKVRGSHTANSAKLLEFNNILHLNNPSFINLKLAPCSTHAASTLVFDIYK